MAIAGGAKRPGLNRLGGLYEFSKHPTHVKRSRHSLTLKRTDRKKYTSMFVF